MPMPPCRYWHVFLFLLVVVLKKPLFLKEHVQVKFLKTTPSGLFVRNVKGDLKRTFFFDQDLGQRIDPCAKSIKINRFISVCLDPHNESGNN